MSIQQHDPSTLHSVNTSKLSQAVSAFTLGCVATVFSLTAAAEENQINALDVSEKTAYTHVQESEESLLANEINVPDNSGNIALISQIGDGNRNTINQNRISQGSANYASIDQYGNFNEATINQEGSQNIGLIYQEGNRHEANITQTGNQFESQVTQYGLEGEVNISQSGSGYRSISVEQQSYSGNAQAVTIDTN